MAARRDYYQLSSNASEVLGRLNRLPSAVQTAVVAGFERGLIVAEGRIRRHTGVRMTGSKEGLGSRLTSYVQPTGPMGIEGAIGFRRSSHFPYEIAQEFGAKAAPGKAMTVPVSPRAKSASRRGQGARQAFGRELFIIKRADQTDMNRAGLLATREGRNRIEVHYVLIRRLKPRLRFRENVRASIPQIARYIEDAAPGAMQR